MKIVKAFLIVALAAGGLVAGRTMRVESMNRFLATRGYEDVYHVPPGPWLRVMSLGHREALANLLWMRALLYYTDELIHRGTVEHVFDYTEAILALDPEFKALYRWVSTSALYTSREPDIRHAWRVVAILERAVRKWPDDGELAWDLGAVLSYEIPPLLSDPEEKERARQRGLGHLQTAALLGAGPEWLVLTNAAQLKRLGRTEQAIRHLEEMYSTVRDADTRQQIEFQLANLRSQSYAEALREVVRGFERDLKRNYPYMDPNLYLHVHPRPPVDAAAMLKHRFLPPDLELESDVEASDETP